MFQPELRKLYYSDKAQYEVEYERRFNAENVVRVGIDVGKYQAFIYPDYRIYETIIATLRVNAEISGTIKKLPKIALQQFMEHCIVGEILQTNNIEGVASTRKEISDALIEVRKRKKNPRNIKGIVTQYVRLMRGNQFALDKCQDIRDIYDSLVAVDFNDEEKGNLPDGKVFRAGHVSVISETQKEIHHGLYPEDAIVSTMDRALAFLAEEKYDRLIRIAAFHYLFGYIHPFYDGNGRTSRFISSILLSDTLNPLIGFRISYTIKENLSKYYKAFKTCNDEHSRGDISPFVYYFLTTLLTAQENLNTALSERYERWRYYERVIDRIGLSKTQQMRTLYSLLIQASLFSNVGISADTLCDYLDCSRSTVMRRLSEVHDGILVKEYSGRTALYRSDLSKIEDLDNASN